MAMMNAEPLFIDKLMRDFRIGGKQVHDANIVATMLAYDTPCLLTHNTKDFERFADLIEIRALIE